MTNFKRIELVLRVSVAGEFIGHGVFALQGKQAWTVWMHQLTGMDLAWAQIAIFFIGIVDVFIGLTVLIKPIRPLLLWAAVWGFWTALVRPLVGESIWEFVERWANWGAPLTLWYVLRQESAVDDPHKRIKRSRAENT